ncbi:hypothetical protein KAW08_03215 [bacterium]|nr:hypothetical protein [bacterium]
MAKIRIELETWEILEKNHAFNKVVKELYDLKKEKGYEIIFAVGNQEKNIYEIVD